MDINKAFPLLDDDDNLVPLDERGNPVEPDLKYLRENAEISMSAIPEIIKTASPLPVRRAEKGKNANPLRDQYAELLAKKYGVSVPALRAAEAKSGADADKRAAKAKSGADANEPVASDALTNSASAQQEGPAGLAETITHHLERMPTHARPSDADIASAINARAGKALVVPAQVFALRTGALSQDEIRALAPEATLYDGLADILDVPAVTFQSSAELTESILLYARALAGQQGFELQARGSREISPQMAAKIGELVAEVKAEAHGW
ncbi:hypothetical protein [Streptomyces lydicus]|uniref:hypothetical protein n=1 Tax=Streptomyces lydicus TaxID=47763 RepID=UPI0010117C98|nr:hypothetical protein [Streptomyces lydicus]MCZ1012082.1 hypothetical protein [Streptomyces lydicus]